MSTKPLLSSAKRARGLSHKAKKMGKGKGTFVEVVMLLEDSWRSKYVKIWSSRSKFEQCSGVCVGKWEFCFFVSQPRTVVFNLFLLMAH